MHEYAAGMPQFQLTVVRPHASDPRAPDFTTPAHFAPPRPTRIDREETNEDAAVVSVAVTSDAMRLFGKVLRPAPVPAPASADQSCATLRLP